MSLATQTQTRIYNRVLALLGSVQRSTSPDDGLAVTDTLNQHWAMAVRTLHAEHPWNHAIARETLTVQSVAAEDDGWLFDLPADCLRWLPPSVDDPHHFRAVQEGRQLLADSEGPHRIRYLRAIEDVSAWPPHFVDAMVYRLAYDAAQALTQSAGVADEMRIKYEGPDGEGGMLARAKYADGLASGDRDRGNVVLRSRALGAAFSGAPHDPPSRYWG